MHHPYTPHSSRPPGWLIALLAALLALLAGIAIVSPGDDPDPQPKTTTVHVDTADPGKAPDDPMRVPTDAIEQAAASDANEHDNLRDETPPGVPDEQLDAGQEQQEDLAKTDDLPIVTPLAAPSQRGCRTRIVQNTSSRRGVRPRLLVAHYTVSPNRPGWGDVDGITALFDRPSFKASSTYVIDRTGLCNYIVREYDKPWTQAGFNPVSISVEIINSGRESTLMDAAGYKKVGLVFADAGKRWSIPLAPAKVSGCTVVRPGIIDHAALGACGGGHHDVGPYSVTPIVQAARAAARASACDKRCARRREHAQVHVRYRQLGCGIKSQRARHPGACRRISDRNRQLHRAGL